MGGKLQGIIPCSILLAVFGGLSIWLYCSNNGAYIFSAFLTAAVIVLIPVCIYRAVFVKVLIGEEGVYHQTKPGNGKYYEYADIIKAWDSSGKCLNGTEEYYCNFMLANGQVIKFLYFACDDDGIEYFLKRVEKK
ncbi:MAG: hypothetical protein RRZ93_00205 [Ruthenibacterium sp.]